MIAKRVIRGCDGPKGVELGGVASGSDRREDPDDDRDHGEDDELSPRDRETHVVLVESPVHQGREEDPERQAEAS